MIIEGYKYNDMMKLLAGQVVIDDWDNWYSSLIDSIKAPKWSFL